MATVLEQALAEASRFRATPREIKALVEAGLVESNLTALAGGDRDSTGFLQQRPSQGWGPVGESVGTDTRQFLEHARALTAKGFRGSAGQLAQAVQRSAFPGKYDQRAADAVQLLSGSGGSSGSATLEAPGAPSPASSDAGGLDAAVALLQQAQQKPQIQTAGLQAPSFSARPALPQGYAPPQGGGGPVSAGPGLDQLLSLVASSPGQGATPSQPPGGTTVQAGGSGQVASGRMPTARDGKIIGTPYSGTHNLGNWQSDNAVDIAVPKGTPMVAIQDGVVVKVTRHPQGSGRFAGDQVTVRGANGNEYFYAHGVADVKAGQRVRKGQELGTTGSANGVEHLHFGQMKGDPRQHVR